MSDIRKTLRNDIHLHICIFRFDSLSALIVKHQKTGETSQILLQNGILLAGRNTLALQPVFLSRSPDSKVNYLPS
ncbi:MAG: hypothetical protein KGP14_07750 [Betaproteobacteria bacterium]|nr:hypothetical protein [Betaproteobacteria bacterium]